MAERKINGFLLTLLVVVVNVCVALLAATSSVSLAEEDGERPSKVPIPEPTRFITEHRGRFNGTLVEYTATAGETYIRDKDGKPRGSIFTFAYTKTQLGNGEVRPVTFLWGGGPGSASVSLHMGTYGPQRVSVPSDAQYPGRLRIRACIHRRRYLI